MSPMDMSKMGAETMQLPTANMNWNMTVVKGKDGKLSAMDGHGMTVRGWTFRAAGCVLVDVKR